VYCVKCGVNIEDESSKFCPKCGNAIESGTQDTSAHKETKPSPTQNPQRPAEWKSEGTTLILTIILGIFGFGGIGHIYLGNITRGITILIVGIILLVISIFTFGIGLLALIPFAIWVVFDARKQCRYYNDHLEQTGRPPW
jgi:TM2 domain-containing membrane protein YozV